VIEEERAIGPTGAILPIEGAIEPIELIKATGALEPTEVTEPNEVREVTKRDEVTWIATLATGRAETKKALSIEDVIAVGGAQRTGIGCAADTDTTGVMA